MNKILYPFLFCILILISNTLSALNPVIFLIGPPGSGKGTFSQYLKENYHYNHVSIGDLLRLEIERETELGKEIKETVARGDYIHPDIIHALLTKNIEQLQKEGKPFILDGFGQNEGDVEKIYSLLDKASLLSRTFVLYLEAPDEVCLQRIAGRSICMKCGHVYNANTAKPTDENRCDLCGIPLKTKLNDSLETAKKRLLHHRACVETYYLLATSLFPSIVFDTNKSIEECLLFYDKLVHEIIHK